MRIGVIAASEAVGCTSIAISMAMYLRHIKGSKVAIEEHCERKCFRKIALLENAMDVKHYSHKLCKVDYFYDSVDLCQYDNYSKLGITGNHQCISKEYDYILVDYGKYHDSTLRDWYSCDYKIVVASLQGWKKKDTLKLLDEIEDKYFVNKRQMNNSVFILQGIEKDIEELRRRRNIYIKPMPYISDSTILDGKLVEYYKNIL